MSASTTTDASFSADVLKSARPVLVDFWASWCGPCKQLAPSLDAVATELAGRLDVRKLDIDANPEMPSRYNVRSIPTLVLFKNGEVVGTKVGAVSRDQLKRWLETVIA